MASVFFEYEDCPWTYNGKVFSNEDIGENYGFVYMIVNKINNKKYIGRKYFYKSIKNKKTKKRESKICGWMLYTGSSDEVNAEIKKFGIINFERIILSLHSTLGETNYAEIREQFSRDVLYSLLESGEREYYNKNIMGRYFLSRPGIEGRKLTPEEIEAKRISSTGRKHTMATRALMSKNKTGTKASPEAIENMKIAQQKIKASGKKKYKLSPESKKKISDSKIGKQRKMTDKLKKAMTENAAKLVLDTRECPHCNKISNIGNFHKDHGDKCLLNPSNEKYVQLKCDLMYLLGETTFPFKEIVEIFKVSDSVLRKIIAVFGILDFLKGRVYKSKLDEEMRNIKNTYQIKYQSIDIKS
jgi:hypothetical protein